MLEIPTSSLSKRDRLNNEIFGKGSFFAIHWDQSTRKFSSVQEIRL